MKALIFLVGCVGCGGQTFAPPTDAGGELDVTAVRRAEATIAAGAYHTCAINGQGLLECWGAGNNTEALGGTLDGGVIVTVPITDVTSVGAGDGFTCASVGSGDVYCWGDDQYGELGNGVGGLDQSATTPVHVATNGVRVAGGMFHTCLLLSSGGVRCWGDGFFGDLGDKSTSESNSPVTALGLSSAVDSGLGDYHSCAALANGTVECWGTNEKGQITNDPTLYEAHLPTLVEGVTDAVALGVGSQHSCALLASGAVFCWGSNTYGQAGSFNLGAVAVAAGGAHTCAVLASGGAVTCWGGNYSGQLGDGTRTDRSTPVTAIASGAVAVACGDSHSCALMSDGSVKCWGNNAVGQLGDGTTVERDSPIVVQGF